MFGEKRWAFLQKDDPEAAAQKAAEIRKNQDAQAGQANIRELHEQLDTVPQEQKDAVLQYYEKVYSEFKPAEIGKFNEENPDESFTTKADKIMHEVGDKVFNDPQNRDGEIKLAQTALIRDIQKTPENFKESQRSLEIACADEIVNLWRAYEHPFRFSEDIPDMSLDAWLKQGQEKEEDLVAKYGPLLGQDRLRLAILKQTAEEDKDTDHLVYRISAAKPVLRMTKAELETEWLNKQKSRELENWIKGK